MFDSLEEEEPLWRKSGYTLEKEDSFDVEYFNQKNLPDYMEFVFNGNIVPLSRFSFNSEENVDIIWKKFRIYPKTIKWSEGATKSRCLCRE